MTHAVAHRVRVAASATWRRPQDREWIVVLVDLKYLMLSAKNEERTKRVFVELPLGNYRDNLAHVMWRAHAAPRRNSLAVAYDYYTYRGWMARRAAYDPPARFTPLDEENDREAAYERRVLTTGGQTLGDELPYRRGTTHKRA
jgi:hypothetical protein